MQGSHIDVGVGSSKSLSRLGSFKSGQVGLLKRHRRDFLAPSVLLQVTLSRLEKSTYQRITQKACIIIISSFQASDLVILGALGNVSSTVLT